MNTVQFEFEFKWNIQMVPVLAFYFVMLWYTGTSAVVAVLHEQDH